MSVGWYFARRVALWFGGIFLLLTALLLALSSLLPAGAVECSPWALVAPVFLGACGLTWTRAQRSGEMTAAAASGVPLTARLLPVLLLGTVLQVLFALPEGRMPDTAARPDARVQRGIDGELLLVSAAHSVRVTAAGEVVVGPPRPPPTFKPAPSNPDRYRRQAFFTSPPRLGPVDALDPWLWRFVYALLGCVVPAGLMLSRRGLWWWLGSMPFVVPLLVEVF